MAVIPPYPAPGNPLTTYTQLEKLFSRYQWSGMDGTPGGAGMKASLDPANRAVKVAAGGHTIRGVRWECDAPESTPIPAASAQDRVDRLVLRMDRSKTTALEYVFLKVLTGTAGSTTPPSITQTDDGIFEDYICRWTSAASGALTGLVDERSWMATDGTVPCFSYRRPSSGFGVLLGELDTGKFRVGLGTGGYNTFAEDSGFQQITLDTSHFSHASVPLEIARVNGTVYLQGTVTCKVSRSDAFGIGYIPADMTPRKGVPITAYGEGGNAMLLTAYASGDRKSQLWVTGNVGGMASGRDLNINASWLPVAGT